MRMKWTATYIIVKVTAMGDYDLKVKLGHILKSNFHQRQIKQYYQGIPTANDDENPPNAYTNAEVPGADGDIDKYKYII